MNKGKENEMEYLDVLNEKGEKTGKIKLREECHRDGDWHKVAYIFVVNSKGEIILQKRSKEKATNPNKWTASASGHLSVGDTDLEGAMRELEEEIGVKVNRQELNYLFTVKEQYSDNKLKISHIANVYMVLKEVKLQDLTLQKEEVSDVKYVHYKEFEKILITQKEEIVKHDKIYEGLLKVLHEKFDS